MSPRRTLALLLALVAAAIGALAPAAAHAQGDTSAVAINTKDGSTLFKLAFDIRKVTGDVVDQSNVAIAYSSCTDCRTIAISIQVLLVEGSARTFTPTNAAVAVNEECDLCDSMALAYQFAVGGGDQQLRFTPGGRREIAAINRELRDMPVEQLSDAEVSARVDALIDRLAGVLDTELSSRPRADEDDRERDRAPPAPDQPPPDPAPPGEPPPAETVPGETPPADTTTTPAPAPDGTAPPADTVPPADTTTTAPPPADGTPPPAETTPPTTSPAP